MGIGVAAVVAQGLPDELAALVTETANAAYMQAMTDGFIISAVVLASAVVIAFTLIPTRMRDQQASFDEAGFEPTGDDAPGLEPEAEDGRTLEPVPGGVPEGS